MPLHCINFAYIDPCDPSRRCMVEERLKAWYAIRLIVIYSIYSYYRISFQSRLT